MKRFISFFLCWFSIVFSGCDIHVNEIIDEEPVKPSCETGTVSEITDTSALINCSYINFSDEDECGIVLYDAEINIKSYTYPPTASYDHLFEMLHPGTRYSYYAYIQTEDEIITGDTLTFTTTDHTVYGKWTCAVDEDGILSPLYTVTLNEDGTAGTSDTYYSEPGGWSYIDGIVSIHYTRYSNNYTYIDRKINVTISDVDSPTTGLGLVENSVLDWNTGGSMYSSKDIIMTRNRDMCHTGDMEVAEILSAVVNSTFKNVPEGGECGVYVESGGKGWKVLGDSSKGLQSILIEGLLPKTEYSYYSYVEYDGKLVVGETKKFTTLPMNVTGTWACTQTSSSGRVTSYGVTLSEDGSATISPGAGAPDGEVHSWSCKGKELTVSFIRYGDSSYTGLSLKVVIEDPINPMRGTGEAHSWAENYLTGGATHGYYDLVMTRQP